MDRGEETQKVREIGPLWSLLAGAAQMLESDPAEVVRQSEHLLAFAPGQQQLLQVFVDAQLAQGDLAGVRARLESMAAELPEVASVHCELGLLLIQMGEFKAAIRPLSRVVELEPKHPRAWRALGDALAKSGDAAGAAKAYAQQHASSIMDLKMLEQVSAFGIDRLEVAEGVVREYLNVSPTDLMALLLLGKMHMRASQFESAEAVFRRALEIAPAFRSARIELISALRQQLRPEDESRELDLLLEGDPDNADLLQLKATALAASGKAEEAIRYCEELLAKEPERPGFWLAYAQALRVMGREEECVAAFRKALQLEPPLGEAWWGLSNLKTFRFVSADVQTLRTELSRGDVSNENREFLHFALAKALEDVREYEESFREYQQGNALIRARNPYKIEDIPTNVARQKRRFSAEFFAAHKGFGSLAGDPIFILGLPRSGSTLVEQILASHSLVEGSGELPSLTAIVRRVESEEPDEHQSGDNIGAPFNGSDLKALGEEYLERARTHRRTTRPCFTDKMPSNFHHLGFICAILPNAKIIDVRRHPLSCCLSNFKQIFPFRQGPSYDIADIGGYYRAYVELMAHFDRVLPGRVHRVIYEELVQEPEREIRSLLDYCGLPFEEACLRFYETGRGIRTISSAQVRRPLYKDSIEQWRHFEPWLQPLKAALGPVLETYPAVPDGL